MSQKQVISKEQSIKLGDLRRAMEQLLPEKLSSAVAFPNSHNTVNSCPSCELNCQSTCVSSCAANCATGCQNGCGTSCTNWCNGYCVTYTPPGMASKSASPTTNS